MSASRGASVGRFKRAVPTLIAKQGHAIAPACAARHQRNLVAPIYSVLFRTSVALALADAVVGPSNVSHATVIVNVRPMHGAGRQAEAASLRLTECRARAFVCDSARGAAIFWDQGTLACHRKEIYSSVSQNLGLVVLCWTA